MHTQDVRMQPVPLWGRCTGSTDFTSRKKNTRKRSEPRGENIRPIASAMEVVLKWFCQF